MQDQIATRLTAAKSICTLAGAEALRYFRALDTLQIDRKGHQDLVSEADRDVEVLIRKQLAELFPDDGIVGEEHAPTSGTSGFTWVIDPIDGTTNFVHGIPTWAVVLACVRNGQTEIGVVHDPVHHEMFNARRGAGAFCNDMPIKVCTTEGLHDGSVGIGFSNRSGDGVVTKLVDGIVSKGGVFYRNASGAVSLAYVAAGRLIGFSEDHMNAWDCLAGQLLVAEAGGIVEDQNADAMIANGGRVIVGVPEVFDEIVGLSEVAFNVSGWDQ